MQRTALSALAELLESLSIRFVLIGALAANRYRATPRLTRTSICCWPTQGRVFIRSKRR